MLTITPPMLYTYKWINGEAITDDKWFFEIFCIWFSSRPLKYINIKWNQQKKLVKIKFLYLYFQIIFFGETDFKDDHSAALKRNNIV